MFLKKSKLRFTPILGAFILLVFLVNPSAAAAIPVQKHATTAVLHTAFVNPVVIPVNSAPNAAGGAPFCNSGSLGTILCYPPSFLKKAYDFPASLTGKGQSIFIVDAFGYPTSLLQSDLNTYDSTFGIGPATLTILCGPHWTDASSCPLNTLADISTAASTPGGVACSGIPGVEGWMSETMLDVTMVHSLAPGAHIYLVVANDCYDTSLFGAEMAVVTQSQYKGSIMSQSFGEPDDLVTCTAVSNGQCVSYDPTLLNNCVVEGCPNLVFQTAKANHWTVLASSADDGANTDARVLGTLELTPSFPATSPLVLAAGGTQGYPYGGAYGAPPGSPGCTLGLVGCNPSATTFTCAAGATCNTGLVVINGGADGCSTTSRPGEPTSCYPTGYGGEGTWNEALVFLSLGYASGGGFSMNYGIPSYQSSVSHTYTTAMGVQITATGRMTPDVSFNAAVYGGVMTYLNDLDYPSGHWFVNGGTSAASPAWAGIMALANQANGGPLGFVNPAIYGIMGQNSQGRSPFHDITQGTNQDASGLLGEDGYIAGRGYDMTTGWGTPDVAHFINALAQNSQGNQG